MLYRKIESLIEEHLKSDSNKILLIDGARQIGKTFIINHVGKKLFENYIEINMIADSLGDRLFENTKTVEDFYLQVSMLAGDKMKSKESTLIFIDEIQAYPHLLTLLKFLSQDNKFTYIASGSLLGVTLSQTTSIPMGDVYKRQGHTDEQDHVHCRRADPARGKCPERSRKNRQKLADVVARLAGIAGASRLGNPDHALRDVYKRQLYLWPVNFQANANTICSSTTTGSNKPHFLQKSKLSLEWLSGAASSLSALL